MKKCKIKKFWEKHKENIMFAGSIGMIVIGSGLVGWKLSRMTLPKGTVKLEENTLKFLEDCDAAYKGKRRRLNMTISCDNPIGIDDLGKLGENFLKAEGTKPDQTYTHFLAIGEYKE